MEICVGLRRSCPHLTNLWYAVHEHHCSLSSELLATYYHKGHCEAWCPSVLSDWPVEFNTHCSLSIICSIVKQSMNIRPTMYGMCMPCTVHTVWFESQTGFIAHIHIAWVVKCVCVCNCMCTVRVCVHILAATVEHDPGYPSIAVQCNWTY